LNLDESSSSRKTSQMNMKGLGMKWANREAHRDLEENNVQARIWELNFLIVRQL
jgi:hypothetical protein